MIMRRKNVFLAIAVICLILTATPCAAMFDAYLQIDGIKGESQDKDHKDWIQVLNYNQRVSQPTTSQPPSQSAGRSGQSSLPAHGDLTISKLLDKSTPKLFEACSTGKVIKFADIDMVRNGQVYLRVHLENVVISSIISHSGEPISAVPQEQVSLKSGKITWTYMSPYGGGSSSESYDSSRMRVLTY
jgi:type VI secretion system secreted protein Hcp